MSKIKVEGTVKVRVYNYLSDRVEDAIQFGWNRAHKHTATPTEQHIITEIDHEVMNVLCDIFNFEDDPV